MPTELILVNHCSEYFNHQLYTLPSNVLKRINFIKQDLSLVLDWLKSLQSLIKESRK